MNPNPREQAPISRACAPSGGANGTDARFSNATNVKSQRLSARSNPQIRTTTAKPNVSGGAYANAELHRPKQQNTLERRKLAAKRWQDKPSNRPIPNNQQHPSHTNDPARPLRHAIY